MINRRKNPYNHIFKIRNFSNDYSFRKSHDRKCGGEKQQLGDETMKNKKENAKMAENLTDLKEEKQLKSDECDEFELDDSELDMVVGGQFQGFASQMQKNDDGSGWMW